MQNVRRYECSNEGSDTQGQLSIGRAFGVRRRGAAAFFELPDRGCMPAAEGVRNAAQKRRLRHHSPKARPSDANGRLHARLPTLTLAGLDMDPRRKSLIELNAAVGMWAITALFAKWIPLPAIQITGLRSAVAAATLFAVLRWQGHSLRLSGRRDVWILAAGGLAMGAHWVTYFQSIQLSTVALGILSLHTYPVMTAVVEPIIFKERVHWLDVVLALLVLLGVAVLVPGFSLDSPITRGVLLGVLSAAFFTLRNVLTRRAVTVYGGARVTFYQLLAAALLLVPLSFVFGQPLTARAGAQLLLLGALFTAVPHTLYTNSLIHLKARSVGIIATLLPVYGSITAALLLGEIPSRRTLVGGAIILSAVALETARVMNRQGKAS